MSIQAGFTGVEPTAESRNLPFDAYVTKPVGGEALRATVQTLLDYVERTHITDSMSLVAPHSEE
jgi:DNA-binding response OmpR family regulator